ncbi:MAG: helix-turn-helix domain-containing protein, partial [Candidatus Nitrosopolaris sp.]
MNIQVACTFAILHRNKPWVSYWLKRYVKEGVEGLKDKPKSGRPSQLPKEIVLNIGKKLSESKRGWSTKQVNDIIEKEGGG